MTQIAISSRDSQSPSYTTRAAILKNLTSYAPKHMDNLSTLSFLNGLSLADPNPTSSEPIHILIGSDLYNEVILDERRKGAAGQPTAQRSIFGWVLSEPIKFPAQIHGCHPRASHVNHCQARIAVHHCCDISALEKTLTRFWEIESIPTSSLPTPEEGKCEEHFQVTHSRASDGRYKVRLPFKTGPPIEIGTSRPKVANALTR